MCSARTVQAPFSRTHALRGLYAAKKSMSARAT